MASSKSSSSWMEFRPGVMMEALVQRSRPDAYFERMLGYSKATELDVTAYLLVRHDADRPIPGGVLQGEVSTATTIPTRASVAATDPGPRARGLPERACYGGLLRTTLLSPRWRRQPAALSRSGASRRSIAAPCTADRTQPRGAWPSLSVRQRGRAHTRGANFALANSDNCPAFTALIAAAAHEWQEYAAPASA